MNLDDIKLSSVKYQMKSFTVDAAGTTFDVPPSQIACIKIEKNYDMMNYPFCKSSWLALYGSREKL